MLGIIKQCASKQCNDEEAKQKTPNHFKAKQEIFKNLIGTFYQTPCVHDFEQRG